MVPQGCLLALAGKALDAVRVITSGITAYRSTGSTNFIPFNLSYLAMANSELGQFDDARRCVGEAMTVAETTKERWWDAEINRLAGEIALKSPEAGHRKPKIISIAPSRSPASNKPNPTNSAPQ